MATRKPARVLPEPVGAAIRVSVPWAMSGQPCSWGAEGPAGKRRANQVATAGWNPSSSRGDGRVRRARRRGHQAHSITSV